MKQYFQGGQATPAKTKVAKVKEPEPESDSSEELIEEVNRWRYHLLLHFTV